MMFCRDICNHFLSITTTKKVVRRLNRWNRKYQDPKDYKRCGYCDIQLKGYNQCPCCGHPRLTTNETRYQRRSKGFKDSLSRY